VGLHGVDPDASQGFAAKVGEKGGGWGGNWCAGIKGTGEALIEGWQKKLESPGSANWKGRALVAQNRGQTVCHRA